MKLELKRDVDGELCLFANGQALPAQAKVEVHQSPGQIAEVVVTFVAASNWNHGVRIRQMDALNGEEE